MTAPMDDIRVVEIASFVAVPAAGALLADLGAEVIKVEVPRGETLRHATPRRMGYRSELPESPHFQMDNRGKRSLALDLSAGPARRALRKVIARADVVLTNLLPGRLRKFGLDAATLRRAQPELIFASLNGFGARGPEADTPAFDYTAYWARTGMMDTMRDVGAAPAFLRPGVGDHAAALALVSGILAALRERDRSGAGQEVGVNLLHMGLYIAGNDASLVATTDQEARRHDPAGPRNPLWAHYRTADERWIFLVMIDSQRYWPALCRAIERPELERDERFANEVGRYRNSPELTALLAARFAEHTLADWQTRLAAHSLIWSPVQTLLEATRDPQVAEMQILAEVEHPEQPGIRTVAPPIHLSSHAMPGTRPAPALGAEGTAVLREAGCSAGEIEAALPPERDR
ncbi:MAG: CoA transferase [Myxococcota bacterium]|nr:CoA transferase [Myxococcota bacterium]